ncbi:glycosyltransferase [Shouchella miscanthi]|uniref:glycosyltransferase n=1 Tax=Shouchella miscanthi TaxID=2598861 RepID=UPI002E1DEC4B
MVKKYVPVMNGAFMRPRIVAFIPAHNEEKSIRDCLEGLADQVLPAHVLLDIIVIADNCTDLKEQFKQVRI